MPWSSKWFFPLNYLKKNSNTHPYHAIMLGAFNMPKYDWLNDTPLSLNKNKI
jgi:hypothetical protein